MVQFLGIHGGPTQSTVAHFTNTRWNGLIAANMVPVLGNFFAGIAHIAEGRYHHRKSLLARGIVEMTIVGGMLLSLIDLVITVGRLLYALGSSCRSTAEESSSSSVVNSGSQESSSSSSATDVFYTSSSD